MSAGAVQISLMIIGDRAAVRESSRSRNPCVFFRDVGSYHAPPSPLQSVRRVLASI